MSEHDIQFMKLALTEATKGVGKTSPNPAVGAVVVADGRVVARGWHRRAGTAHAEIAALRAAGAAARGATLYVSLEPCNHTGRTGPCTTAIIEAGIRRVVMATTDPNPRVRGRGRRRLQDAGLEVRSDILAAEARQLNEAYFHVHRTGRPFVTVKVAVSLDGQIATAAGDSRWITGLAARRESHRLRASVDAVVIGGETARLDDPSLTVRHTRGRNPHRVIVTASGKLPGGLGLLNTTDERTVVATTTGGAKRVSSARADVWSFRTTRGGRIAIDSLLERMTGAGWQSVLLEGGGKLIAEFLRAGRVDKWIQFTAPIIIGPGRASVSDLGIEHVAAAVTFERVSWSEVGKDQMFVGYPKRRAA